MKLVIAYIKPERFKRVKRALYKMDVHKMSVSTARGCGQQKGFIEIFRGPIEEVNLLPKIRLEIAVNDEYLEQTLSAIMEGAETGEVGDGKVFVLPVEECLRIRTHERGTRAIG